MGRLADACGRVRACLKPIDEAYSAVRENYLWSYHFLFEWAEQLCTSIAALLARMADRAHGSHTKRHLAVDAAQKALRHRRQASLQCLKEHTGDQASASEIEAMSWLEQDDVIVVQQKQSVHQMARTIAGRFSDRLLNSLRACGEGFARWSARCWLARDSLLLTRSSSGRLASSSTQSGELLTPGNDLRKRPTVGNTILAGGTNLSSRWSPFDGFGMFWLEAPARMRKKTLVLDLDETLVHSQFKRSDRCDVRLEVLIDAFPTVFFVNKRPHVDTFLRTIAMWYNVIVFTASLRKYADPLIDALDTEGVISARYFRESCVRRNGNFVKNLEMIEPDLANVAIVDNSPAAYQMQRLNAIPVESWYDDPDDEELLNLLPLLHSLCLVSDVRSLLSLRTTHGMLQQQCRPGIA